MTDQAKQDAELYPQCSTVLRLAGKPYPRTCRECGLGPCKRTAAQQPTIATAVTVPSNEGSGQCEGAVAAAPIETPETDAFEQSFDEGEDDASKIIEQIFKFTRDLERQLIEARASFAAAATRLGEASNALGSTETALDGERSRAEAAERKLKAITGDLDFEPTEHYKIADMANVGHAFLREIAANIPKYCYNDSPAEIICELLDKVTDAERERDEAKAWALERLQGMENWKRQCESYYKDVNELRDLKSSLEAARGELPRALSNGWHSAGALWDAYLKLYSAAAAAIASRDLRIRGLEADVKLLDWIQENHRAQAITESGDAARKEGM
jgi:hypothetical protein